MSEESNRILSIPADNLQSDEAQSSALKEVVRTQPMDAGESKKNLEEQISDTNSPALLGGDSSAESAREPTDMLPSAGKPATFDEYSNVESEKDLMDCRSSDIEDNVEEPQESDTLAAALEAPAILSNAEGEHMDSDDKDVEIVEPKELSNVATENLLEDNVMTIEETPYISDCKEMETDSEARSSKVPENSLESTQMQTDEQLSLIAEDILLEEDPAETMPLPESDKSLVDEPEIENLQKEEPSFMEQKMESNFGEQKNESSFSEQKKVTNFAEQKKESNFAEQKKESNVAEQKKESNVAEQKSTGELHCKDIMEKGKEPEEVVSVDLCNEEDTAAEEVVSLDLCNEDNAVEDAIGESLSNTQETKELSALPQKSAEDQGEIVENVTNILEKELPSPQKAKELDQKIETTNPNELPTPKPIEIDQGTETTANKSLDTDEQKDICVIKENDSEEKQGLADASNKTMDLSGEIKTDTENKELHKEHSNDIIKTTDDDIPEESVETMDTCDSQESTTLVIDETSDINESAEAIEHQSKEDINEAMDTVENVSEEKQKGDDNIQSTKSVEKVIEKDCISLVDDDVQSTKTVEKENEKDCISLIDEEIKNDKTPEAIQNKEATDRAADDDVKDDDVIPIELPPMPIIEIDDDTDDEPSPVKQSPFKQPEEKRMDIDQELTPETSTSKQTITPMEVSAEKESENSNNELLTVASEKTMDVVVSEEKNKTNDDVVNEDTTDEVFYNKECINYECCHKHKQFFRVPQFAFSYFKVNRKKFKTQYICADCYDKALDMFEEYCGLINAKQPLLMENIPSGRQEFVEIIDSSDEEDGVESTKVAEPAKSAFSKNDLSLIERELHTTIKSVLERVEIQNQLTWSKTILTERLKRLEMETDYVDSELRSLQRKADKMHEGLYSCPKIKIRQLQPLDLNSGKIMGFESQQQHHEVQPIPPVGEIERPTIQTNVSYFAVKNNAIASWVPCKVVEQVESGGVTAQKTLKYYRIKFLKSQHQMLKTVPAKYLAYYEPPTVRLPIGTRVIAYFDATSLARGREKMNVQSAFYPGIIAEPLKPNNKFRYLIFYDDGYTQYVYHKDVRLVCHVSENVWEDVHPASRDFIQKYLTQYSINRPMVQTQKGQSMNTESNGYWLHARVVDIDCSLVLMQFEGSKSHTEWIYRGSLRLGPVFKEYQKTLQKNSNVPHSRLPRRTEPFIRYTEDEESSSQQQQAEKTNEGNRAVARKSFGRPDSMLNTAAQSSSNAQKEQASNTPAVKHLNNSTIYVEDENKPKGKVVYYTAKRNLPPRRYTPHMCSPGCLFEITHNLSAYSPLSKPLLSGWERFIIRQKIKKVVTYRAPCGKIFRNMKELHHYLRVTRNLLNVDNFDFSPDTNCLAEYVIESAIIQKRDISCGQEKMAIPLVNYYDTTLPPECKYSAKVIPTEGVHINKDPEFFAGCDCDDDCSDKSKCSCWQLTVAGAKYGNPNTPIEEVGYQYKRLLEHVPTGIYECNPRCKCKQNCLNRVVQQSLQLKLQVFKTSNRGWGLRCINDVPRGTFVCVYAGHLLTEAKANEGGQDAGDEYFAELDYIEVAEQIKEGYESEVEPPEAEDEDAYQPELDDDDFTPSKSFLTRSKRQSATKSTRPGNHEDDSQERQVINFNPNADMNEDSVRECSIRNLYGKDEACYVMDAKISGNLGRYFNHSCAPNMFVQNVFVDTHDLRFPWVAFFSSCNIRAGTELTWNYNYEVGVVPGKVLYCQCGAPTCRLRLL